MKLIVNNITSLNGVEGNKDTLQFVNFFRRGRFFNNMSEKEISEV